MAIDCSPAGAHALQVGRAVAPRLGARLTPLLVQLPLSRDGESAEGAVVQPSVPSGTVVVEGIPAIEIPRYAEGHGADLVILTRQAGEDRAQRGLGPTWEAVIRRAEVPCLVLPECQERLSRLLVALDGSERGMAALRGALQLRRLSGDGLSAIYVEPLEESGHVHAGPSTRAILLRRALRESQAGRHPIPLIERRGDVVTEVLSGLSSRGGDVLVVGVRRGGPADTADSTGTGRRLLAKAPCAVLTVPL